MPSSVAPRPPVDPGPDVAQAAAGAVDAWDMTARIEAAGVTDRTARALWGHPDVFSVAEEIYAEQEAPPTRRHAMVQRRLMTASLRRALLIVACALLSAAVQHALGISVLAMGTAGGLGWVAGQTVAGTSWHALGAGQPQRALDVGWWLAQRLGQGSLVLVLLYATLVPDRVEMVLVCLGWMVLTCCLSLLLVVNRYGGALLACGAAAGLAWLLQWPLDGRAEQWAVAGVALTCVLGVACAVVLRTTHVWRVPAPTGTEARAAVPPLLQALVLVVALLLALNAAPANATTAMVAGIVGAMCLLDPWITGVRVSLANVAHRSTSLGWSRSAAWSLVLATSVATALVCAGAVLLAAPLLQIPAPGARGAAYAAAGFGVPAALSALLAAFGDKWGPLVPAVGALVTAWAALALDRALWVVVVAALCTAVSLLYSIRHFHDARVFV